MAFSGNQWNTFVGGQNGAVLSNNSQDLDSTKVMKMMTESGASPTTDAAASWSPAESGQMGFNWSTADATAREIIYVAFGRKGK